MAINSGSFEFTDNSSTILQKLAHAKEAALEEIGQVAEGFAKKKCPVDTGNLRNSISHTADKDAAYIGTNVYYAPYVEMGTVKMEARPFLKPAATEHSNTYESIMKKHLENG